MLKTGTVVDATLIAAPSSTKNSTGTRDPERHQTRKGNQWHFGMKAHIGVDADSELVHTVIGTAANVNDVTQGHGLLRGDERDMFADAGYQGAMKRAEPTGVAWHVAMRPGKRRALDKSKAGHQLIEQLEQNKASIRANVEHPFWVIKRQCRLREGALPGVGQEHGAVDHAVCPEQFVDGQKVTHSRNEGMRAPAIGEGARKTPETAGFEGEITLEIDENPTSRSSDVLLTPNSCFGRDCANLPDFFFHSDRLLKIMEILTNLYSKIDLEKVSRQEIRQKHRIAKEGPINSKYLEKKIPILLAVIFILLIPFCTIDLFLKKKYRSFFVNTLKNDLTIHLAQHLGPSLHISRFSFIKSKIFLLPLKIYSRSIRGEWIFANSSIQHVIEYFCSKYIILFINTMRGKIFFVRDDYHAEPSFITSISLVISDIFVVSFQHGSMDLSLIEENQIYPGQRARLQIVHDKFTAKTFSQCNLFNAKIILSDSCYIFREIDYSKKTDLVFIGNSSSNFLKFSELLALTLKDCAFISECYYKPHPSEKVAIPINLKLRNQVDDYNLIADGLPKIFLGASSTVLYDAAMAGYKIILVTNEDLYSLDSLANLADFPTISSTNSAPEIIYDAYLSHEVIDRVDNALNYDLVVEQVKLLCQKD